MEVTIRPKHIALASIILFWMWVILSFFFPVVLWGGLCAIVGVLAVGLSYVFYQIIIEECGDW